MHIGSQRRFLDRGRND